MKTLFRLNRFIYRYRWRFLFGILFTGLTNYFRVLQPVMVREAIDMVFRDLRFYHMADGFEIQTALIGSISTSLIYFMLVIIGLALMMSLFMYFMRQTIIVMSRLIEYDIRKEIYQHFQTLDQGFYRQSSTGDLMSRVTEDVSKVRMYLGPAIMYGINLTFLVVMVVFFMFRVNTKLAIYTLLPLPILSLSIYWVSSLIHKKSFAIQVQLSKLNSIAQEVFSGIKMIKSYVQERAIQAYFNEEAQIFRNKSLELARVNAFFYPLMLVLIGVGTVLVIYIGGLEVINGEITPGNVAEFIIYLNMLTWPVTSIGWVASLVQQASASQKRILELLDTPTEIKNKERPVTQVIQGAIWFDNVHFTYQDTGIEALKGISFKLAPGQKMLVLGKTASGKTTLADLILRLYDVTKGELYIDRSPIADYDLGTLRSSVAYVPQDVFLFSDTVRANIAFTNPDLSMDQIEYYAGLASIHEEILGLPQGYDSVVGERGVTLSGGQKQRISIARALASNPRVIIFDDSLSAVDSRTEEHILKALDQELEQKTTILIAHRIPLSIQFDLIIYLDDGRLMEVGDHAELLKSDGHYARLYNNQQSLAVEN